MIQRSAPRTIGTSIATCAGETDAMHLTPFAHVGAVPAQPFRVTVAAIMLAIGAAAAGAALLAFERRDLTGA
jgi:putative exporter of polyketide antibiotics